MVRAYITELVKRDIHAGPEHASPRVKQAGDRSGVLGKVRTTGRARPGTTRHGLLPHLSGGQKEVTVDCSKLSGVDEEEMSSLFHTFPGGRGRSKLQVDHFRFTPFL